MRTYTYYPFKADGTALGLEVDLQDSDGASIARARQVLEDHRSAEEVEIWEADRLVLKLARAGAPSGF